MSVAASKTRRWTKWRTLPMRVFRRLARQGVAGALERAVHVTRNAWRERWLGISTAGSIPNAALGGGNSLCYGYQPIEYGAFEAALQHVEWGPDDVFADYGSGMGRAVILAATRPLSRVIGVERSAALCDLARDNLRRAVRHLACRRVEIVCADATEYLPPDTLSLLFLYNPFAGDVLRAAMEQVRRSLARSPRRLQVIYALPAADQDLLSTLPWLRLKAQVRTNNDEWVRILVYEHSPQEGSHVR